jgi:hypothetical protein
MNFFTNQEYLDLIQKLVDQQYDDATNDYDIENMEWIPDESEIQEKIIRANYNGVIDLTKTKSSKIKEELLKCANLKVGNFKFMIDRYFDTPSADGFKTVINLRFWEHKNKTDSGNPCSIDYPLIFYKDSRFNGRAWVKYFNHGSSAVNVPIDTVVEIVRWLQAMGKLTAFL